MRNRLVSFYIYLLNIIFPWCLFSLGLIGLYYSYGVHDNYYLTLVAVYPLAGFILLVSDFFDPGYR